MFRTTKTLQRFLPLSVNNTAKFSTNAYRGTLGYTERVNIFAPNEVGILSKILSVFHQQKVTLTQVCTKLMNRTKDGYQEAFFAIDFEGDRNDIRAISALRELNKFARATIDENIPEVPWFPSKLCDLDLMQGALLDTSSQEGNKDHPGFNDPEYRKRRDALAKLCFEYKMGDRIPYLEYTEQENKTWEHVYKQLRPLQEKYMCKQFNNTVQQMIDAGIIRPDRIPQLEDVSQFLKQKTGFQLKPVSGILSQREFLNALALRTFCCTQYIRHHSKPEYTPEPDIIHEMGHAPMFADPDFADLSQQIGLLSLGNTDENIAKLGALYWYTIEFGACKEGDDIKAYGAGIASSIAEIKNFGERRAEFRPLDPFKELSTNYPIQTLQPIYYVANSFKDAGETLIKYGEHLPRPFRTFYDYKKQCVEVDRKIKLVEVADKSLGF